jgi:hypothetical protein
MRAHTDERDEDEDEPAPLAASLPGRSGNPLDLLPPRNRVVIEALRGMGSLTAVAHALGITKQTVMDHRARAARILEPLAQAVKSGVVLYRVCWLCGRMPKEPNQSLCRGCRRVYMRAWRRRKKREGSA